MQSFAERVNISRRTDAVKWTNDRLSSLALSI